MKNEKEQKPTLRRPLKAIMNAEDRRGPLQIDEIMTHRSVFDLLNYVVVSRYQKPIPAHKCKAPSHRTNRYTIIMLTMRPFSKYGSRA